MITFGTTTNLKMSVCYFITKSIFEKKEIAAKDLNEQLTKESRDKNKKID